MICGTGFLMNFGRGERSGPVHATSAFFCVTIQSIRPSSRTTAKESRCVFVDIVAKIWVLLVTYYKQLDTAQLYFLVNVGNSETDSNCRSYRVLEE